MKPIPFNRPALAPGAAEAVLAALQSDKQSGNGPFTKRCQDGLAQSLGAARVLLTPSCTAALEMAALLCDIEPGDEVIMPSFTFVSTANAIVLRGGVPVFVDIRPDTLNIDEAKIAAAIGPRTKAITVVHYAGVACAMGPILALADRHGLTVIEDAAQGLEAQWQGRPLGAIAPLGALSFHDTKNVGAGEGGALIVRDEALAARAEIIWEKGTNRSQFRRGEVDKYSWMDVGSSFLPSEITAAFLCQQLAAAAKITERRLALWSRYQAAFADLVHEGRISAPQPPQECAHNGHIFYLLLPDLAARNAFQDRLRTEGIEAVTHYVPLHSAPAGRRFGRVAGSMAVTDSIADRLIRLPLYDALTGEDQDRVIAVTRRALGA